MKRIIKLGGVLLTSAVLFACGGGGGSGDDDDSGSGGNGGNGGGGTTTQPVATSLTITALAEQDVMEQTDWSIRADIASNNTEQAATVSWSLAYAPDGFEMALTGGELSDGSSIIAFTTPDVDENTNIVLRAKVDSPATSGFLAQSETHDVALTITANSEVVISGAVVDDPIPFAEVTVKVGEQVYRVTADANGAYAVPVEFVDPDLVVEITAVGAQNSEFSQVEFKSYLGSGTTLIEAAGDDGTLTAEENINANVSNVTTAVYVLVREIIEEQSETESTEPVVLNQEQLDEFVEQVDSQEVVELAAVIQLVVDYGADLPANTNTVLELAQDLAANEEAKQEFIEDSIEQVVAEDDAIDSLSLDTLVEDIVSDENLVPAPEVSAFVGNFYVAKTVEGISTEFNVEDILFSKLELNGDNSGEITNLLNGGSRSLTWAVEGTRAIATLDTPFNANSDLFDFQSGDTVTITGFSINELSSNDLNRSWLLRLKGTVTSANGEEPSNLVTDSISVTSVLSNQMLKYTNVELNETTHYLSVVDNSAMVDSDSSVFNASVRPVTFKNDGTGSLVNAAGETVSFGWSVDADGRLNLSVASSTSTAAHTLRYARIKAVKNSNASFLVLTVEIGDESYAFSDLSYEKPVMPSLTGFEVTSTFKLMGLDISATFLPDGTGFFFETNDDSPAEHFSYIKTTTSVTVTIPEGGARDCVATDKTCATDETLVFNLDHFENGRLTTHVQIEDGSEQDDVLLILNKNRDKIVEAQDVPSNLNLYLAEEDAVYSLFLNQDGSGQFNLGSDLGACEDISWSIGEQGRLQVSQSGIEMTFKLLAGTLNQGVLLGEFLSESKLFTTTSRVNECSNASDTFIALSQSDVKKGNYEFKDSDSGEVSVVYFGDDGQGYFVEGNRYFAPNGQERLAEPGDLTWELDNSGRIIVEDEQIHQISLQSGTLSQGTVRVREDDGKDGVFDHTYFFSVEYLREKYQDSDGDTLADEFDTDDDADGAQDSEDAFPNDASEQSDFDNDGIGDNADTDDDNDGVVDGDDLDPFDPSRSVLAQLSETTLANEYISIMKGRLAEPAVQIGVGDGVVYRFDKQNDVLTRISGTMSYDSSYTFDGESLVVDVPGVASSDSIELSELVNLGIITAQKSEEFLENYGYSQIQVEFLLESQRWGLTDNSTKYHSFSITQQGTFTLSDEWQRQELTGSSELVSYNAAESQFDSHLMILSELESVAFNANELIGTWAMPVNVGVQEGDKEAGFHALAGDLITFTESGASSYISGKSFTWTIDTQGRLIITEPATGFVTKHKIHQVFETGFAVHSMAQGTNGDFTQEYSDYSLVVKQQDNASIAPLIGNYAHFGFGWTDPDRWNDDGSISRERGVFGWILEPNGYVTNVWDGLYDFNTQGVGWRERSWSYLDDSSEVILLASNSQSDGWYRNCDVTADECVAFRERHWVPLATVGNRVYVLEWEFRNLNAYEFPSDTDYYLYIPARVNFYDVLDLTAHFDADDDGIANGYDTDGDGDVDSLDMDSDNDGVLDNFDFAPLDPSITLDTDNDGIADNFDNDDDGDGVLDEADAFPLDATESADADGDGVGDNADKFPADATETADFDGDGIGDNADTDDDNDGVNDDEDADPKNPEITHVLAFTNEMLAGNQFVELYQTRDGFLPTRADVLRFADDSVTNYNFSDSYVFDGIEYDWSVSDEILVMTTGELSATTTVYYPYEGLVDNYGYTEQVRLELVNAFDTGLLTQDVISLSHGITTRRLTLIEANATDYVVSVENDRTYRIELPDGISLSESNQSMVNADAFEIVLRRVDGGLTIGSDVSEIAGKWIMPLDYQLPGQIAWERDFEIGSDVFTVDATGTISTEISSESMTLLDTSNGLTIARGDDTYTYMPLMQDGNHYFVVIEKRNAAGELLFVSTGQMAKFDDSGLALLSSLETELPEVMVAYINGSYEDQWQDGLLGLENIWSYRFGADGHFERGYQGQLADSDWNDFGIDYFSVGVSADWRWESNSNQIFHIFERELGTPSEYSRTRTWDLISTNSGGYTLVFERSMMTRDWNGDGVIADDEVDQWFIMPRINLVKKEDLSQWQDAWNNTIGLGLFSENDTDGDGNLDKFDEDDDNDGYTDVEEIIAGSDPLDVNSTALDSDEDGIRDEVDTDDDNDGVVDVDDALPLDPDLGVTLELTEALLASRYIGIELGRSISPDFIVTRNGDYVEFDKDAKTFVYSGYGDYDSGGFTVENNVLTVTGQLNVDDTTVKVWELVEIGFISQEKADAFVQEKGDDWIEVRKTYTGVSKLHLLEQIESIDRFFVIEPVSYELVHESDWSLLTDGDVTPFDTVEKEEAQLTRYDSLTGIAFTEGELVNETWALPVYINGNSDSEWSSINDDLVVFTESGFSANISEVTGSWSIDGNGKLELVATNGDVISITKFEALDGMFAIHALIQTQRSEIIDEVETTEDVQFSSYQLAGKIDPTANFDALINEFILYSFTLSDSEHFDDQGKVLADDLWTLHLSDSGRLTRHSDGYDLVEPSDVWDWKLENDQIVMELKYDVASISRSPDCVIDDVTCTAFRKRFWQPVASVGSRVYLVEWSYINYTLWEGESFDPNGFEPLISPRLIFVEANDLSHLDLDGDSISDSVDSDDDNDGYQDDFDEFPTDGAEWIDSDFDGIGNNADGDDDNDGVADEVDLDPVDPEETREVLAVTSSDLADSYVYLPEGKLAEPSFNTFSGLAGFTYQFGSENLFTVIGDDGSAEGTWGITGNGIDISYTRIGSSTTWHRINEMLEKEFIDQSTYDRVYEQYGYDVWVQFETTTLNETWRMLNNSSAEDEFWRESTKQYRVIDDGLSNDIYGSAGYVFDVEEEGYSQAFKDESQLAVIPVTDIDWQGTFALPVWGVDPDENGRFTLLAMDILELAADGTGSSTTGNVSDFTWTVTDNKLVLSFDNGDSVTVRKYQQFDAMMEIYAEAEINGERYTEYAMTIEQMETDFSLFENKFLINSFTLSDPNSYDENGDIIGDAMFGFRLETGGVSRTIYYNEVTLNSSDTNWYERTWNTDENGHINQSLYRKSDGTRVSFCDTSDIDCNIDRIRTWIPLAVEGDRIFVLEYERSNERRFEYDNSVPEFSNRIASRVQFYQVYELNIDTDADGIFDAIDEDDDNDGVLDADDAFPFDANESADSDGDGIGDNAEAEGGIATLLNGKTWAEYKLDDSFQGCLAFNNGELVIQEPDMAESMALEYEVNENTLRYRFDGEYVSSTDTLTYVDDETLNVYKVWTDDEDDRIFRLDPNCFGLIGAN